MASFALSVVAGEETPMARIRVVARVAARVEAPVEAR